MEFRITSISENPGYGKERALKIELQSAGNRINVPAITAYVPDSGEFHGLTIGKVLTFGDQYPLIEKYFPEWEAKTPPGVGTYYDEDPYNNGTNLPPGGLASEAIEPNERAAIQAEFDKSVHDAVAKNEKWPIEQAEAREEMKKSLPMILRLLKNPKFVEAIAAAGYESNTQTIFKAFDEAFDE